jgi:hypothetical protein
MEAHKDDLKTEDVTLDDILAFDTWAREHVEHVSQKLGSKALIL